MSLIHFILFYSLSSDINLCDLLILGQLLLQLFDVNLLGLYYANKLYVHQMVFSSLQHPLLSGWSLYITAREGLLRHETSRRASRESSLPVLKGVGAGSLVCFYNCLLKADNKISCWSLPLVVVIINAVLYLFSIHLLKGGRKKKLTYFWPYPCITCPCCKVIFSFFS